jgi:aminomethyltransferase
MTQVSPSLAEATNTIYDAARTRVVRLDNASPGRIWLNGRDRAQLLQRLTTNDVVRLQPGDGARTVLTNTHARILDVLTVYALPGVLLVTTGVGQGNTFARFLQSKIFFQDQVTVADRSDTTAHLALYGPQATALTEQVTGLGVKDWPLHHIEAAEIAGAPVWLARTLPLGGAGFTVVAERADVPAVQAALADAVPLDEATLEVLRIEAGYGAPRREWSTEYIPLEANLGDAINFRKGCYVGQEIIARMDSRNRLAKRLMGLRLGQEVAPGTALLHEGKEAGIVTSTARSPRVGLIGLGYVRTAFANAGTHLQLADGGSAKVVELPFGNEA